MKGEVDGDILSADGDVVEEADEAIGRDATDESRVSKNEAHEAGGGDDRVAEMGKIGAPGGRLEFVAILARSGRGDEVGKVGGSGVAFNRKRGVEPLQGIGERGHGDDATRLSG